MDALTYCHADIKNILEQARSKACSEVNAGMVKAAKLATPKRARHPTEPKPSKP